MDVRFVPQGFVARPADLDGTTLFLDVGNALREGIMDHHQLESAVETMGEPYRATSRLTETFPHLLPETVHTLVLHRQPDFDSWLSCWLVLRRLSGRPMPFGTRLLTDFAACNDQGLTRFATAQSLAPIACLLPDTSEADAPLGAWWGDRLPSQLQTAGLAGESPAGSGDETIRLSFAPEDDRDRALLLRGLALVTYLFERLSRLRERLGPGFDERLMTLDTPDLFDFPADWPAEVALAQADLVQYRTERDDPDWCEVTRVPLPGKGTGDKALVDALLWHRVPICRLHKFWARADHERVPDGFVLTAIPVFEEERHGLPVCRVILSTDPATPFDLRHLGPALERAELAREAMFCRAPIHTGWQPRETEMQAEGQSPRFQESWCTNHDPWYDGRAHGHTIVDAPARGSLLSIQEVMEITKGHLRMDLAGARTCVAHPFQWAEGRARIGFSRVMRRLDKHPGLHRVPLDARFAACRHEFLAPVFDLFVPDEKVLSAHVWQLDASLWPESVTHAFDGHIASVELLLLRNGCGLLLTHAELPAATPDGTASAMTAFLADQKGWCGQTTAVEATLRPLLGTTRTSSGYVHTVVRARSVQPDGRELAQLCYKVAHRLDYRRGDESLHPDEDAQALSCNGRVLRQMPVEHNVLFGFAQRGACLCLLEDGRGREKLDFYEERFMEAHFAAFLLRLIQRTTLLSISERLGGLLRGRSGERMAMLIKQLQVECVTRTLFGQIGMHALLEQAYMHQGDMFHVKGLTEEVERQSGAYDAFLREERNRKIKLVTAVYLPMQILDWLVGLRVLALPETAVLTLSFGSTLGAVALLFLVLYAYVLRVPRYR